VWLGGTLARGGCEGSIASGHDPVAPAGAGRQDAVVTDLVGTRGRNQGYEPLDELAALHQDVAGAVAPGGLQAHGEPSVGKLLEAIVRERRPRDVATEPLQTAAVASRYGHRGVETHAAVLWYPGRRLRFGVVVRGLDAVAQSPPALACVGSAGAAPPQRSRREHGEQWLIAREGVFVCARAFGHQPLEAASRAGEHPRQIVVTEGRQGQEAGRRSGVPGVGVDAVESERMEMEIEIHRRAKALDEGDRAALLGSNPPVLSAAPAQLGEKGPHEGAEHLARELRVVGAAVAERVRKREHPLPDRNLGQNAVGEMRGGISHATAAAGGAEAAPFAGEGHEAVAATVVAAQAQKTVGEDAAAQEGAEFLLDEAGHGMPAFGRPGQEAPELLANRPVEEGLLGAVGGVARTRVRTGERVVGGSDRLGGHCAGRTCEVRAWGRARLAIA